jgi:glycosyl transferase family 25
VLEDDVVLYRGFRAGLQAIAAEIEEQKTEGFLLNVEESMLDYVPASERRPGSWIYPASRGRLAGAYLIDRTAAGFCLKEFRENGCGLPIDWFHNHCARLGGFRHYRSHPCLAIQGSLNGRFPSLIDHKTASLLRRFSFRMQQIWKRFRASLR